MSVNDVLSGVAKWWEHVACCTTPGASTAMFFECGGTQGEN